MLIALRAWFWKSDKLVKWVAEIRMVCDSCNGVSGIVKRVVFKKIQRQIRQ